MAKYDVKNEIKNVFFWKKLYICTQNLVIERFAASFARISVPKVIFDEKDSINV